MAGRRSRGAVGWHFLVVARSLSLEGWAIGEKKIVQLIGKYRKRKTDEKNVICHWDI
jgi:hypothetical protein